MERRFFGFLVHVAVVAFTAFTAAGRIRKSQIDPSSVTRTRREFADGPIRLELRATNSDDGDLGLLLETILDVKDFVRLVHVIAVNHRDGIDLSDARDRSKETRNPHGSHWLLEDDQDDRTYSEEIIQPNDHVLEESKRRQKLAAAVSNFRRQTETLKLLTRHFKDVVRSVLTEILADLKNHSRTKRRYKAAFARSDKRDALIEEIAAVTRRTIVILGKRSGGRKEILDEAANPWDELPERSSRFHAETDPLTNLCAEMKHLQRLILENSALCDSRRVQEEMPEEDEGSDDLDAAFEFFTSSSPYLKISDELQKSLNVVLNRIMKSYAKKLIRQARVDCEKEKLTNRDIMNIGNLIDLEEESKIHDNDEEVKLLLQSRSKERHSGENAGGQADGMSNSIENGSPRSDQVSSSDSEGAVSRNSNDSDNANVRELQIPIDNDSEENSDDVPSKSKTTKDHEENTAMGLASIETLHNSASKEENYAARVDTVEGKATAIIPVTENKEPSKIVEKIPEDTDKHNVTADSIFSTDVTEAYNEKNEIYHPTDLSVDTTVSEGSRSTINDDSIDLPTDTILIALNEEKTKTNSTADLSMDGTATGEDKSETINSSTDLPIETTVDEGKKESSEVKNKMQPSIGPVVTQENGNTAMNNATDRPLQTNINKTTEKIAANNTIRISIDLIGLKGNDENIDNDRTIDPPSDATATDDDGEKTNNTNDASIVTKGMSEKIANNTTERNSVEVGPTTIATSTNEAPQWDIESIGGNLSKSTESKATELPTGSDDYGIGSSENQNINANININRNHLRFPLHAKKKNGSVPTNVIEVPDIVTTMRFGSYEMYDKKTNKKVDDTGAETSADRKSKPNDPSLFSSRSDGETSKEMDHPLGRELVPPSKEMISNATSVKVVTNDSQRLVGNRKGDSMTSVQTRRSLGPSPDIPRLTQVSKTQSGRNSTRDEKKTERKRRKKNIMDIILESITSIVADNSTHWAKPQDEKKSRR